MTHRIVASYLVKVHVHNYSDVPIPSDETNPPTIRELEDMIQSVVEANVWAGYDVTVDAERTDV